MSDKVGVLVVGEIAFSASRNVFSDESPRSSDAWSANDSSTGFSEIDGEGVLVTYIESLK